MTLGLHPSVDPPHVELLPGWPTCFRQVSHSRGTPSSHEQEAFDPKCVFHVRHPACTDRVGDQDDSPFIVDIVKELLDCRMDVYSVSNELRLALILKQRRHRCARMMVVEGDDCVEKMSDMASFIALATRTSSSVAAECLWKERLHSSPLTP